MPASEHPAAEDIHAWIDRELPADVAATIETHVAGCAVCAFAADSVRAVSRALARWDVQPAPFVDPRANSDRAIRPANRHLALLGSVAAVMIVGVVLWYTWPQASMDQYSPQALAQATKAESVEDLSALRSAGAPGGDMAGATLDQMASGTAQEMVFLGQNPAEAASRGPLIVRTASLSIVSRDFARLRPAIDGIVAQSNGFIAHMQMNGTRGSSQRLEATLRVPEAQLPAAVAALKQLGTVVDESQAGEDVTAAAVDLDARLSNARETEKRLVAVLQQRTGKVSDVLEVEREIARVRGEIERMTTSREQLQDRARYATVTVRVTEEARASLDLGTPSAAARLRNAFVQGVSSAFEGALAVSVWVIGITPALVLLGLAFAWPLTIAWRRFRAALRP